MSRKSLSGMGLRAPFLDTQIKAGAAEVYSGGFTANFSPLADRSGAGNLPMQITYTPTIDAWWEVLGHIGILLCDTAAYVATYCAVTLPIADVDGATAANSYGMQHSQVNAAESREMCRLFKLAAGTTYTANLAVYGMTGGTWRYYCGPNQLWIQGKAWPR